MYALLLGANVAAWIWALIAFHHHPVLLGTALVAYAFGLRHAVDADHIAAIDNVTRKLMQQGKRPVAVGLYFSLGHSSIVFGLSVAIALCVVWAAIALSYQTNYPVGFYVGTISAAAYAFARGWAAWARHATIRGGSDPQPAQVAGSAG